MRGISKNQYNQVLHIDESGNLFGDDRYFIISAIRFSFVVLVKISLFKTRNNLLVSGCL